jgi:serine/threonine-protein kinase
MQRGVVIDGRYEIRNLLGRGGQGDVYLAYDRNFAIEVAIKFLHPDYRTEEFMERFRVDAQATVRLTHPNVVRVFDFNPQYPYMVMEYCGDGDLDRHIKSRKRRSLKDLLDIVRQVCEGLAEAHENRPSILHRDIKPGNVLFKGATPKLTDFGLAKMIREGGGLTTTRGLMGTVRYCSPQQLRDASTVDHRADLWSMGVLLYELLTWTRPFDRSGDDQFQIMRRIDAEPPHDPSYPLPEPVLDVVRRSLEKDPARRFGSARDMGRAIQTAAGAVPGAASLLLPPEDVVDEMARMASEVADLMSRGESQEAATIVTRMRKIAPEDSLGRYWNKQVRHLVESGSGGGAAPAALSTPSTTDWRERVESLVAAGDFRAARKIVGERIAADDDITAQDELQRITEAERQFKQVLDRAMAQAQEARAAGDPGGVVAIWTGVSELYPRHPTVQAEAAQATSELKAAERVASRNRTLASARARAAEGDAQAAIEILKTSLREDPGSVEIQGEIRTIQQDVERRAAAARLAALNDAVARLRSAGDLAGAIEACDAFLLKDPDVVEAIGLRRDLAGESARKRRTEALGRLQAALGQVEVPAESGRYRSVPPQEAAVRRTLQEAAAATQGDAAALESARVALLTTRTEAERALRRQVAAARARLVDRFRAGREWSENLHAGESADAAQARRDLGAILAQALEALASPGALASAGDPVAPLAAAETRLNDCIEAVTKDRRAALEAVVARARAIVSVAAAEVSVAVAVLKAEPSGSARAEAFEQRLRRLQGLVESGAPRQVESVTVACPILQAEAEAARIAVEARARRALEDALDEAAPLLLHVSEGPLAALIRQGAALLRAPVTKAEDVASHHALAGQLRTEAGTARAAGDTRMLQAGARWQSAVKAWQALLAKDLGTSAAGEGRRATEAGAAAMATLRTEDLNGWTAVLEALTRRYRLESAWIDQCDPIGRVERGLADDEEGEESAPARDRLAKYRVAMARGDLQTIASLGPEIAALFGGRPSRDRTAARSEVPTIGAAMRRLNGRLLPEALKEFDDLARRRQAPADRHGPGSRDAASLEAAYRRLLRPVPLWKQSGAVIAVAMFLLAGVAVAFAMPRSRHTVTVMSPAGEARLREVLFNGAPLTGLATSVSEAGTPWTGLRQGHYVIRMVDGAERSFSVPGEPVVMLPAVSGNVSAQVAGALGLQGETAK